MSKLTPAERAEADRIYDEAMRDLRGRVRGSIEAMTARMIALAGRDEVADHLLAVAIETHQAAFGRIVTASHLRALAHRVERGEA